LLCLDSFIALEILALSKCNFLIGMIYHEKMRVSVSHVIPADAGIQIVCTKHVDSGSCPPNSGGPARNDGPLCKYLCHCIRVIPADAGIQVVRTKFLDSGS